MRARYLGHRGELRSGADVLGKHFLKKENMVNVTESSLKYNSKIAFFAVTITTKSKNIPKL